jgi:glycine oxidase
MRVVIVGAGLVGTAIARAFARRGCDVVVVEKGVPGAEASWAAGGILSPLAECDDDGPMLRLCLDGLATTRALAGELQAAGHDVQWLAGGTLDVAFDEAAESRLTARLQWQERAGFSGGTGGCWLDADAVRRIAPVIGDVRGGAWFPDEASLDPRLLFLGLRATAEAAGATFLRRQVTGVSRHRVVVAVDAGVIEHLEGDAVIVAAGAWTPQVAGADVAADVVFPVRGQMLELQGAVGALAPVIFSSKGYVVPRKDGRVLAGSTMEQAGFEKALTPAGLASLGGMVQALVPSLQHAPVLSTWAGLRPGTKDGLPLLGQQPSGVWIASGHFRNGVLLAAQTAALLERALLDGDDLALRPFSPTRFG